MIDEKIKIQVLLELALQQSHDGNTDDIINNMLPLYMRKLNCFVASVFSLNKPPVVVPFAMRKDPIWQKVEEDFNNLLQTGYAEILEFQTDKEFYIAYPLSDFGWLLLGKKQKLPNQIKYDLKKVVTQLGRSLRQSEEEEKLKLFQKIINSSSDAIQVAEENGNLFYINEVAAKRLGISQEDSSKYSVRDFEEIFKNEGFWQSHLEFLKEQDFVIAEGVNLNQQTGERFPVEVTVKYVKVGNKGFVIANSRDISNRKESEKALQSLSELQTLLMKIASEYINLDLDRIDENINNSLREIGRFVASDRAYIFDYNFVSNDTSNTYEWCSQGIEPEIQNLQNIPIDYIPFWVDAHRKGEALYIPDVLALPEDGEAGLRAILEPQGIKSLITLPIIDGDNLMGFVGFDSVKEHHIYSEKEKALLFVFAQILVNVKKRYALQMDLVEETDKANAANRAKSEFLANMSHEIRTPLNSILGFSEVMLNTTTDSKQQGYLRTILDSGRTLLSLINDILDLSKIEAGRMEVSPEPTSLVSLINDIKQLFSKQVSDKNLKFNIEFSKEFPNTIIIDEVRLRQILLNLIGNAIKFTFEGYIKIEVLTLKDENGFIDFQIQIIDTGIGIAEDDHNKIFESFSQQSGQDSRKFGGTGLGLAICKRLTELMGGTITLESTIGAGSTFTLNFKKIKHSDETQSSKFDFDWNEVSFDFKKAKVLIVDDVPLNRKLIRKYLEPYNFELYDAANGLIAIESAIAYLPDLILMDIRMPGLNGHDATTAIRNYESTSNIPIIAITTTTLDEETKELKKNFDGYFYKPFQQQTLITELSKFLKYEVVNIKTLEISEEENLTSNNLVPQDLAVEFKMQFSTLIESQADFIIFDEMTELVDKMYHFAIENNLSYLKNLNNQLKEALEAFDFERIQTLLAEIKAIFNL